MVVEHTKICRWCAKTLLFSISKSTHSCSQWNCCAKMNCCKGRGFERAMRRRENVVVQANLHVLGPARKCTRHAAQLVAHSMQARKVLTANRAHYYCLNASIVCVQPCTHPPTALLTFFCCRSHAASSRSLSLISPSCPAYGLLSSSAILPLSDANHLHTTTELHVLG